MSERQTLGWWAVGATVVLVVVALLMGLASFLTGFWLWPIGAGPPGFSLLVGAVLGFLGAGLAGLLLLVGGLLPRHSRGGWRIAAMAVVVLATLLGPLFWGIQYALHATSDLPAPWR